ncbi:hypothetical protein HK098_006000 [Nowakowskiella sp. JEL0407]|nr:hypothetical protein HK098_006000 [Nowakowskiella sp. JEL0407]
MTSTLSISRSSSNVGFDSQSLESLIPKTTIEVKVAQSTLQRERSNRFVAKFFKINRHQSPNPPPAIERRESTLVQLMPEHETIPSHVTEANGSEEMESLLETKEEIIKKQNEKIDKQDIELSILKLKLKNLEVQNRQILEINDTTSKNLDFLLKNSTDKQARLANQLISTSKEQKTDVSALKSQISDLKTKIHMMQNLIESRLVEKEVSEAEIASVVPSGNESGDESKMTNSEYFDRESHDDGEDEHEFKEEECDDSSVDDDHEIREFTDSGRSGAGNHNSEQFPVQSHKNAIVYRAPQKLKKSYTNCVFLTHEDQKYIDQRGAK